MNSTIQGKQNQLTAGSNITIINDVISSTGSDGGQTTENTLGGYWTTVSDKYDVWKRLTSSSSSPTLTIYAKPTIVFVIIDVDARHFTGEGRTFNIKLTQDIDDATKCFGTQYNLYITPNQRYQAPFVLMNSSPLAGQYALYVNSAYDTDEGTLLVNDLVSVHAITV